MTAYVHIFLIAVAFILAVSRIAFSYVKKRDIDQGLYLNDRAYTLLGTLLSSFMSKEKREAFETTESFSDYVKRIPSEKKKLRTYTGIYIAAVLLLTAAILAFYGMNEYAIMNIALILLAGSMFFSFSEMTAVAVLALGIVTGLFSFFSGNPLQLLVLLFGVLFFIGFTRIKKEYKKNREKLNAMYR